MEITTQADYYGLPERTAAPVPPPEKIAEQLAPAVPWERPLRVEGHSER